MSNGRIILTSVCVAAVVCTFKSCGSYVIKNEDSLKEQFHYPVQSIQELFNRKEEQTIEYETEFDQAKEQLEETLEKMRVK